MMACVHILENMASAPPSRSSIFHNGEVNLKSIAIFHGISETRFPVVCQHNGKWVSQKVWKLTVVNKDDIVLFIIMPRDNGTLRTVASLSILLVAAIATPYLLGAAGIVGTGALFAAGSTGAYAATALTTAALVIGGNYLLNVVVPIKPGGGGVTNSSPDAPASPTYANTLSSQQNIPRLGGAIPVLYGRVRMIPDLAATPWSRWSNNYQFLHQVLVITQGEVDIEQIFLGSTPISAFEDIEYEIVQPNAAVALIDDTEVYTVPEVAGITMLAPNDVLAGDGDGVDDGTYGPFSVCPPGEVVDKIGLDFSFPQGMYSVDLAAAIISPLDAQWIIEARQVDDFDNELGAWDLVSTEYFSGSTGSGYSSSYPREFFGGFFNSTADIQRQLTISYRYTMPVAARYQVRCKRITDRERVKQSGHVISWVSLKGFMPHDKIYGNVTVLAMRMRASNSVNNRSIRQVAVIGTRKLPIYDLETQTWSAPTSTRSIAAAISDMMRNQTYGGRRADRDIDLDGLWSLESVWGPRFNTFDWYASQTTTLMSAIAVAARSGRATPYHQAGVLRMHRDQPQDIPVQMFSRENIVKGTFKLTYIMPSPQDETDGVEVKFLSEVTWTYKTIRVSKTSAQSVNPSINNLDGVVQPAHAQEEVDYLIAADRYRRIFAEFDTEMDGMIPSYGDLVLLCHDVPRWGSSARILDYDPITRTITLWNDLDLPLDAQANMYFATIRDARGRPSYETPIASFQDDLTIVLADDPVYADLTPFDFTARPNEPLHIVLGTASDKPTKAIFLSAIPRGNKRVSIRCVLDDIRVYVN